MKNKNVLTQNLINLIHVCTTRLSELNNYTEEEMTISNEDLCTVAKSLQDITKIVLVNEIPF